MKKEKSANDSFYFQGTNIESVLPAAAVAYRKAHKDIEAELTEDVRKLLKQQKAFADK